MSGSNELQDLQQRLLQTQEPRERRDILARMLVQIQVGWNEFFESLANEQNPKRMLLMLAELDEIFESRKNQLTQRAKSAHG